MCLRYLPNAKWTHLFSNCIGTAPKTTIPSNNEYKFLVYLIFKILLRLDSFRKRTGVSTADNFQSIPKECTFCLYQFINGEKSHTEVFGNNIGYVFLLQLMEITLLDDHYLKMYYLEFGFLKMHVKSKELDCIYKWGLSHVRAGRRKSHYR